MKLTRREFVQTLAAGTTLLADAASVATAHIAQTTSAAKQSRPNIVFILADDMGWGDLSCYGRPDYHTPNIDLLASQGTRFTDAYSASAICTPTRCGYITGRYPARFRIGLEEPLAADNVQVGLEPGQPTIASLLKQVGYDTALIGKWHLGFRPEWGPNAHGFDEFFGILAGAGDYFLHKNGLGQPDLYENLTPVERRGSAPIRDRTFFWRIADQDAVRDGKWKFFRRGEVRRLFDLSFDEHEQADFSNKDPEVLRRLMGKFDRWNKEMRPRPQP